MNRGARTKKILVVKGLWQIRQSPRNPHFLSTLLEGGLISPMGWLAVSFFWFMRFHEFTVSNSQGLCGWACGKKCDSLKVLTPWVLQPVFFPTAHSCDIRCMIYINDICTGIANLSFDKLFFQNHHLPKFSLRLRGTMQTRGGICKGPGATAPRHQ